MSAEKPLSQFVRYERYALTTAKKGSVKGRTTQKSTVWGVCNEANRMDGYTSHIVRESPTPFVVMFGQTPLAVAANLAEIAKVAKDSNGKKFSSKENCMVGGVASFPTAMGEGYDPFADLAFVEWCDATIEHLKKVYGGSLRSVILHTDENHPHLHFYAHNDMGKDGVWKPLEGLDPSKDAEKKLYKELGRDEFKKSGQLVRKTTIEALVGWQKDFWEGAYKALGYVQKLGARDRRMQKQPKEVRELSEKLTKLNEELASARAEKEFARELTDKAKALWGATEKAKMGVQAYHEEVKAKEKEAEELIASYKEHLKELVDMLRDAEIRKDLALVKFLTPKIAKFRDVLKEHERSPTPTH